MRDNMGRIGSAVGVKRKRVVSGNEPSHSNARPAQESGRHKRLRSSPQDDLTEEEEDQSPMEVDTPERWSASDESEEEDASDNSTDDYFINIAMARELLRLRKDELIRIYEAAGLSEDVVAWTKQEITEAIISSRDEVADLPPSSPGRTDAGSSECSSEDGNEAEDDAEIGSDSKHRLQNGLRRRATINDLGRLAGKPKGQSRSLSLDHINTNLPSFHGRKSTQPSTTNSESSTSSRRKIIGSNRSSSSAVSQTTDFLPTPLASRLRPRKVSAHSLANGDTTTPSSKGKAKAKQVEFDDDVTVRIAPAVNDGNESDLTDLAELEEQPSQYDPSPRRLRSKGPKPEKSGHVQQETAGGPKDARRVVPMRKAKGKIGSLKEDDDEDDEEEVEEEVEIEVEEEAEEAPEEVDELIVDSGDDEAEDEEVDELISTTSASPSPPPPKKRNISTQRPRPKRVQTFTPPSDSDGDDVSGEGEGDETLEEEGSAAEEDDETVVLEPKILRNGKVVGDELEEDLDVEEDIGEEDDEDLDEGGSVTDDQVEEEVEIDQVGMDDEGSGSAEEDVDLTIMTAKALVRLRRDDLVRMCESRDLDVAGTKPQLAEALLQWRNRRGSDFSSPSSSGTARPSSTARPQNGRSLTKSQSTTPPVLLRSHRFHLDEPRTPPVSSNRKDNEQELELDLGRLGLDDREIPPEKLTKLEKIGSGGFKDVFIGKFRGRKIAIAEFRGQLNSMDIKELKLLGGFDHPNIVRFLGVSIPENTRETPVMIVSELCSNGDLFDYVRNVPPPTLHRVVCMMLDIARGLEYLHLRKPSVIHRDCKSSNILITSKGVAKIADFGLAKVKQSTRSMVRSLVGTVNWQAPELWHAHPKYNHKVDVFSCAMVYWEMLQWYIPNKKYPWEGMNEHAIYDIVGAKRQRPSVSGLRKQWCPEIVDLMERMWAHEHQDRPTMSDVVKELEQLTGRR